MEIGSKGYLLSGSFIHIFIFVLKIKKMKTTRRYPSTSSGRAGGKSSSQLN